MTVRFPPRLRKGDMLGVISPASPPQEHARIARGVAYLLDQGFQVRLGSSIGLRSGYLAGPDSVRAQDIHDMFLDDRVRGIVCTRGGYGSSRLLECINWERIKEHPKILVGFSDITALSLGLFANAGLVTFSGPMLATEFSSGMLPTVESALYDQLMSPLPHRQLALGRNVEILRAGNAEGRLLGGNLSVFCSLIGTSYLPNLHDSVLFFEDVGEEVYRIDRMLLQLKYAGILEKALGIVLGTFTSIPNTLHDRRIEDVFEEYLLPLNIPVLMGAAFGHIPEKITLPVGARVLLEAGKRKLRVLDQVVT